MFQGRFIQSGLRKVLASRSALAYLALLLAVFAFLPGAAYAGSLLVAVIVLLGWREMRYVPRGVFLVACCGLVYAVLRDVSLIPDAAANVTRLAGLILAVMLLSIVLGRSRDLQRISVSLFGGKPLTRYLSLAFGTALVSIPLNFGSVAVVGSLVGERIRAGGDSPATRNATRAVLRGFGTAPSFSPLSISVVLTLTLLPGLPSGHLIAAALPFAVLMVFLGVIWREPEAADQPVIRDEPANIGSWLRFGGLIVAICTGVFVLSHAYGVSYAHAVTLSCLAVVIGARLLAWSRGENPPMASMDRVSNELAIVGGSAFIGAIISGVVLGEIQGSVSPPDWAWPLLAALVPWTFFVAGLSGINPIVIGTLIGGILGSIWPSEALLGLGVGMVTGWGITAFGTPFAANALIMERLTGYRARDASLRWSLALSFTGLAVASMLAASLTLLG
ncbi:hypothetical protein [Marinobacter fonticola]|uniref:hypothetical protein n=1 Tax=Marinobacter fonticola TaxID=2603215 RepID=UPI0011E6A8F7|nr:hypothetical protein [Marinobacter fonticola]